MTLTINIDLDNAAFEDGSNSELNRVLSDIHERLPEPLRPATINLYDVNGNHVGIAKISD